MADSVPCAGREDSLIGKRISLFAKPGNSGRKRLVCHDAADAERQLREAI
jgi:hypothetical protein